LDDNESMKSKGKIAKEEEIKQKDPFSFAKKSIQGVNKDSQIKKID